MCVEYQMEARIILSGPLASWTSPPSTSLMASMVIADAKPSVHPSRGRRSPNHGNGDVQGGATSEWQDAPRA